MKKLVVVAALFAIAATLVGCHTMNGAVIGPGTAVVTPPPLKAGDRVSITVGGPTSQYSVFGTVISVSNQWIVLNDYQSTTDHPVTKIINLDTVEVVRLLPASEAW